MDDLHTTTNQRNGFKNFYLGRNRMLQQMKKIVKLNHSTPKRFACKQGQFRYNRNNCWFASASACIHNNVYNRPVTLSWQYDIEDRAYAKYLMPKWPTGYKWGVPKIAELENRPYKFVKWHSREFNDFLDKGYVLTVSIQCHQTFISQWWSGGKIVGGKGTGWGQHIICLFKHDGKYYLLNSWDEENPVRELESLYVYNLFKKREDCGVIF